LAGNIANVNKTITLDSTPPQILFIDSTEQNNSFVSRDWIYANVSVTEINEANITFSLYNETMDLIDSSFYITPQREITWNSLPEGVYYYEVAVSDLAGNYASETRKITLDTTSPVVSLISPIDRSGSNNGNLIFNYSVADNYDIANCSLILNNSITQTNSGQEFSLIDLAVGPYNWSVICTDAASNNGTSLEWFFSSNRLTEFSGSTTDLSQVDVFNITSMTLETLFGKIIFPDPVDFSNGIDVDSNGDISFNSIEINGTALPELNKPAILDLYSLTFTNPAILEDGSPCSSCVKLYYSGGILSFSVAHFTVYSAKETAAEQIRHHYACPHPYLECEEWSACQNNIQTRRCTGIDDLCDPIDRIETQSCSIALPAPLPIQLPVFPWLQIIIAFIILCLGALGWYLRRKYLLGLLKK
jgi:hypothetical protein